jgi:hypothetical protein
MPKIVAYAPCGGNARINALGDSVMGGANNLSGEEYEQFKRAKLMTAASNDGDIAKAKAFLEEAGWTCYWEGPPPNDSRLELRLPSDLKSWVLANGGSDMIRRLIEAARERQEAETTAD